MTVTDAALADALTRADRIGQYIGEAWTIWAHGRVVPAGCPSVDALARMLLRLARLRAGRRDARHLVPGECAERTGGDDPAAIVADNEQTDRAIAAVAAVAKPPRGASRATVYRYRATCRAAVEAVLA